MARLTALAVLLLALTACGGGDNEQDAPPLTHTYAAPAPAPTATPRPSAAAARPTRLPTGAQLGGRFCAFLAREQGRLAGLDSFAALTRLSLDLAARAGEAVDGDSLQAQARACPGPARAVLRATGLRSFSAL